MQLTNEELDKIVEEAVNNNIIIYSDNNKDLIKTVLSTLFTICPIDLFIVNNKLVGIEYFISNNFEEFDNSQLPENLFPRKLISNEQYGRVFDKFKELSAIWPKANSISDIPSWFFITKTSWGRHYFAAIEIKSYFGKAV